MLCIVTQTKLCKQFIYNHGNNLVIKYICIKHLAMKFITALLEICVIIVLLPIIIDEAKEAFYNIKDWYYDWKAEKRG